MNCDRKITPKERIRREVCDSVLRFACYGITSYVKQPATLPLFRWPYSSAVKCSASALRNSVAGASTSLERGRKDKFLPLVGSAKGSYIYW